MKQHDGHASVANRSAKRATSLVSLASLMVVAALAGCGTAHHDAPTRAEYVKRIDAICGRFDARGDRAERDMRAAAASVPSGDFPALVQSISPPLARLVAVTDEAVREMRAVARPTSSGSAEATAWSEVLGDQTRTAHKLRDAVSRRDQEAFLRLVREDFPALAERTHTRAQALGLKRCASRDLASNGPAAPAAPAPSLQPSPSPEPSPAPGGQDGPRVVRAGLGEPLRVTSTEGDVVLRVVRVRSRVKPNRFSPPEAGEKIVGVDLDIRNVGAKTFSPPLVATAQVIDTRGRQGGYATLISGPCGRGFALNPTITPGTSEQGCLPFAIDEQAAPARLQVRLGFGADRVIAEFDLRGSRPRASSPSPA